jgi:hypothetical protein
MTVSWFGPQNQVSDGLSVAPQNRQEDETTRDTRRDLAAYLIAKQVGLGVPSLASKLADARCGWCTWLHRGGRVEVKQKMTGSMASGAT